MKLQNSINIMKNEIASILGGCAHSIWLYGSVVMDDHRIGWSDIDFIAFSNSSITDEQAEKLLYLRQELSKLFPNDPYFRSFEGVITCLDEYLSGNFKKLVYWGTSGQRITSIHHRDVFAEYELNKFGVCVYGNADRNIFRAPSAAELVSAVKAHYDGMMNCACETDESLYSCGWLLDISRCIYTLKNGAVISKTSAGEWAVENGIFADDAPLVKALKIRRSPLRYKDDESVKRWLKELAPTVREYAKVLETELEKRKNK